MVIRKTTEDTYAVYYDGEAEPIWTSRWLEHAAVFVRYLNGGNVDPEEWRAVKDEMRDQRVQAKRIAKNQ